MANNKTLRSAKKNKKDEFYTQEIDISSELINYKEQFRRNVVWCPCDDYDYSNFVKFLEEIKSDWEIKKIIATCYPSGKCRIIDDNGIHDSVLDGDGSFDSEEVQSFLEECDIVTTNPPFSRFDEFVERFVRAGKKVCILGPWNAFFNKVIFKLYHEKLLWLGHTRNKTMWFEVPDGYKFEKEENGRKFTKVPGISWWTNFEMPEKKEKFSTDAKYNPDENPKYLNFDAIHVGSTKKIPMDYAGLMGVPGNYINEHDGENFELIGVLNGYGKPEPEHGLYCGEKLDVISGSDMKTVKFSGPVLPHPTIEGANKAVFGRLLIKNKKLS